MKPRTLFISLLIMIGFTVESVLADAPGSSHGIKYPTGWTNWSPIAVSHRADNNTIRLILGNKIAIEAARANNTNPWPDGAILGKVVWKNTQLENWKKATAPGQFVHAEFMFKDSNKYFQTQGWGWARWVGLEQKPFNEGAHVCISCHTPVNSRDWVFSDPAQFPNQE